METTAGKTTPSLTAMAVSLVGEPVKSWRTCNALKQIFWSIAQAKRNRLGQNSTGLIALIIHEQGIIIAKNREMLAAVRAKNE